MKWHQIRERYPEQWLLVEAIQAHSELDKRILDDIAVLDVFPDSTVAWKAYTQLRRQAPQRELYVLHTHRTDLEITESRWLGIRSV